MTLNHICTLALWLTASTLLPASVAPDSKSKAWPANPAKHQVTIVRTAANDSEKKMLALAEAAAPAKAAGAAEGNNDAEPKWWNKEVTGIRIPCAITGAAVAYYTELVTSYQKQAFNRLIEPNSKFSYEASVSVRQNHEIKGKTLPKVYVVKMKLTFSEFLVASAFQGIQFDKQREVILDPEGKVLAVTGDGDTEVPIVSL